MPFSEEKYSS